LADGGAAETAGDETERVDALAVAVAATSSACDAVLPQAVAKRLTMQAIRRPRIRVSVLLVRSLSIRVRAR